MNILGGNITAVGCTRSGEYISGTLRCHCSLNAEADLGWSPVQKNMLFTIYGQF